MPINALSLFANVGIGETYLSQHGIQVKVANELLASRALIHKSHHPDAKMVQGDITDPGIFQQILTACKDQNIKFIIATPPCQGMSVAGRMDKNDPRNTLIVKAMDAFTALDPDYMLIENVPQMLKTSILYQGESVTIVEFIKSRCGDTHECKFDVFDCADYGTAQTRKRAFVRIHRKSLAWPDPVKQARIPLKDVIGDLPSLEAGEDSGIVHHKAKNHNARHILWMQNTPSGKTAFENTKHFPEKDGRRIRGFSTTYKRMSWETPAPTVTMGNGSISSQNNVHPGRLKDGHWTDARVLTLLELKRVMGLPDQWGLGITCEQEFRHVIGEAVPPRMVGALVATLGAGRGDGTDC